MEEVEGLMNVTCRVSCEVYNYCMPNLIGGHLHVSHQSVRRKSNPIFPLLISYKMHSKLNTTSSYRPRITMQWHIIPKYFTRNQSSRLASIIYLFTLSVNSANSSYINYRFSVILLYFILFKQFFYIFSIYVERFFTKLFGFNPPSNKGYS